MSYLPTTEAHLRTFGTNFSALTGADPATFGLVAGDAATITAAAEDFATKYDLAVNPVTRTKAAIVSKNNAKDVLIATLRAYAMAIKTNRAVADEAKANLGLGAYDATRTPVSAPERRPVVGIVGVDARRHVLRFSDPENPEGRARPDGVRGVQLFCALGESAPTDPLSGRFRGVFTRKEVNVDFEIGDAGKLAHYYARWQTDTGLVGPWSVVTSISIAG